MIVQVFDTLNKSKYNIITNKLAVQYLDLLCTSTLCTPSCVFILKLCAYVFDLYVFNHGIH